LNNTATIYFFDLVRILSQFYKKLTIGQDLGSVLVRGLREAAFLIYLAISLFFLISLMTFDSGDPGWSHNGTGHSIANAGGAVGAWLADFALSLLGIPAFLFPFLLSGYGYSIYKGPASKEPSSAMHYLLRWFGFGTAMAAGAALADIHMLRLPFPLPETSGGILGQEAAGLLVGAFGTAGATVLLLAFFVAGF
jgi:S-DNA-T family DNA segregation ATPase FtsK/SpoIIIE